MEFLENVEEARENAEIEMKSDVGNELDAQKEQDEEECQMEGVSETESFIAPDFTSAVSQTDFKQDGLFKRIQIDDIEVLQEQTRNLDHDQRLVLDKGIDFAKQLVKATSQRSPLPAVPYIIVQGGAGTGKSHVINLLSQWIEKILRSTGDNLNHPYVVKCAFSGTAASNIGGQTLHSAFNLGFGNNFFSLNDKTRDVKRNILSNLKILIIDEFSMVKSDMLYQLDLMLKEIKQ